MPVRKVSNRGRNTIGRFASLKMGQQISYESTLERDLLLLLDFDPNVTWIEEQPVTIHYRHQGKKRRYTPDLHTIERGQHIVYECKPRALVNKAQNQIKFEAGRDWCAERGWSFQVVTDQDLWSNYRVQNVELLTQFARHAVGPEQKERLRTVLTTAGGPLPLADLLAAAAPEWPQSLLVPLLHMAYHHELVLPLDDAPIGPAAPVALPRQKGGEP